MSIGNLRILYVVVVVCSTPPAYTSSCRGLESYFIQNHHFRGFFLDRSARLPYVWKKYHRNERHLCLVAYSFIKLSQNICLINIDILMYWQITCSCKLWHAPLLWLVFFKEFLYIIDDNSWLKYCIFTKLSQIVCSINVHILVWQHAKYDDCRLWKVY